MKVLVLGAGGAAANGFSRALRLADNYQLVGANCDRDGLALAEVDEKHFLPHSSEPAYASGLLRLVERTRPDLVHAQNDEELAVVARLRDQLPVFLPSDDAIHRCQNKWLSYVAWRTAGIPQPETFRACFSDDIREFAARVTVWLRPMKGAGGRGSLCTDDPDLAVRWLDHVNGWGTYTAAQTLSSRTITCQTLWYEGKLVCSQQRRRVSWHNSRSTPTGVTGSTGIGETCYDDEAQEIALRAVRVIDEKPHGLYGVDMAYNHDGIPPRDGRESGLGAPNPTEINVGRFFTTVPEFYARAGMNIADLYCRIAAGENPPSSAILNPLPDGLRWVRGMDCSPVLTR